MGFVRNERAVLSHGVIHFKSTPTQQDFEEILSKIKYFFSKHQQWEVVNFIQNPAGNKRNIIWPGD